MVTAVLVSPQVTARGALREYHREDLEIHFQVVIQVKCPCSYPSTFHHRKRPCERYKADARSWRASTANFDIKLEDADDFEEPKTPK